MYLIIIFLPLFSAVCCGFFGSFFNKKNVCFFSCFCIFFSFFGSMFSFFLSIFYSKVVFFTCAPWIVSGSFSVSWGFFFDSLTCVILFVVTSVSFLVHLYSSVYIEFDPHLIRFISYLSFFTFFILILVSADNFIQMFLGWEGVGLCSFLLINFWFTRLQANKAAIKAIIVNRVGDFFLAIAIFIIFMEFGSLDYVVVFGTVPIVFFKTFYCMGFEVTSLFFIALFIFGGAVGKSAQFGLHSWLPDAIEGPTPVSALIHAATMVTAGVFLLVRCSPLFEFVPRVLDFITIVGALTAFFAATVGLFQNDLKKVIAYSTCSQLGYMVFVCGLSSYNVSIFHLANHAFFKALLFLTAGVVIHALQDEQDIRKIGGLVNFLPFSFSIIFLGSLALAGFPFLSGFYSKDVILEVAYSTFSSVGHFSFIFGVFGAFFTAFYSIRLLSFTFFIKPRGFKLYFETVHDASFAMFCSLIVLSVGSLFFGFFIKDVFLGVGSTFWQASIFFYPSFFSFFDAEFLDSSIKLLPFFFSTCGLLLAYLIYNYSPYLFYFLKQTFFGRSFYFFFNKKWYFDKLQTIFIVQPVMQLGYRLTYKSLDRGLFELVGPHGISCLLRLKAQQLSNLQTSQLYHYLFFMVYLLVFCFILLLVFFNTSFFFYFFLKDIRLLLLFFMLCFFI